MRIHILSFHWFAISKLGLGAKVTTVVYCTFARIATAVIVPVFADLSHLPTFKFEPTENQTPNFICDLPNFICDCHTIHIWQNRDT
jgi:hypothetical protein